MSIYEKHSGPHQESLQIEENLIGQQPFGFTLESIERSFAALRTDLTEIQTDLADPALDENMGEEAEAYRNRLTKRQSTLQTLLLNHEDTILATLQCVYDFVRTNESRQLTVSQIIQAFQREKPGLFTQTRELYSILRQTAWGYRLGQKIFFDSPSK